MIVSITLTGSTLLDCALALTVAYIAISFRSYQRLSHIPGPKSWALSRIPIIRTHIRGEIYETFGHLSTKYGPLVRIGPNTLLTSNPDVMRRMSAARSPYTRSDWFYAMRLIPGKDNILSLVDDAKHDERRRQMAMGYSGKENKTLEIDIDDCVRDLVGLIDSKYLSSTNSVVPMDLAQKCQFFTSDVMSKIAFDSKFHDLRDDCDNLGYIRDVETFFPALFWLCTIGSFVNFCTKIGLLQKFSPESDDGPGLARVLSICKEQIAKRFDAEGNPKKAEKADMLSSFIRHGISQADVEQESVMQMAAGSDTTATGMRGTLLALMTHPGANAKLVAELKAAMADGRIPSGEDEVVSDEAARKLPYLQACIKEGLRYWVPIAGMLAKQVPSGGDTIDGYFVPGGISIAYSAYGVHKSPALFGPDQHAFRPERWIHVSEGGDEPSRDKITAMERNNELIFGHGKYQCLGKPVAMIELNKTLVEIMRRYDLSLTNAFKPWSTTCYGIHLQRDMMVTVRKREGSTA